MNEAINDVMVFVQNVRGEFSTIELVQLYTYPICSFLQIFFDREIAQALAVLQVAVIVVMILVKIELYGAIAKNSSFAISKSDSESE